MNRKTAKRWKVLCKQVAIETDPRKLSELNKEIDEILRAEEKRLSK
jgi:hypothetical protein